MGTDGKLGGGQAMVPGVAGTWKDLTDFSRLPRGAQNLHGPGKKHRRSGDGGGRAAISRSKLRSTSAGKFCQLKEAANTMVDQHRSARLSKLHAQSLAKWERTVSWAFR